MKTETIFQIILAAVKALRGALDIFSKDIDELVEDLKTDPKPVDPTLADRLRDLDV